MQIVGIVSALGIRGDYQRAETTLTLREGLAEYYRVNPGLSDPARIDDEATATYFRNHDCTHVVFGTHTGPLDEGVNDLLTMFGVDIRVLDYVKGFFSSDVAKSITKTYFNRSLPTLLWRTLRLTPRVWRTTRAMRRKWPWTPPPELMDRPLQEIRREYGIELLRPEVALGLVDEATATP